MNAVPVIGWIISFAINMSLAIPFWVCWTWFQIGETYFDFLPYRWHVIPFWHCIGIFISIAVVKIVCTPKLATINQSVNKE